MKTIIIAVLAFFSLFVVPPALVSGYVVYQVMAGDYSYLEKNKILDILSKETTVFYSDGTTQLGSLFGSEHRQYVPLKSIPNSLQDAVVAAEDDGFYSHIGIDPLATLRAAFRNIVMRKREGASTITQQTVKNLYGRPVTNLRAKFMEAINSFKMERKYSKKEILEFYLNQFHVTGNGRGVGVAAKYYFDKEVSELTVSESAFIAGSVKGPERYNPFTKRTLIAQTKARVDAKIRKNYVLKRMFEKKYITKSEYEKVKEEEVPFRQGKFQFNELFVTELVQRQINRKEVLQAIGAESIDTVGTMGLRITTTLSQPVQSAAQFGVRQNLSRLEMILSGFQKAKQESFVNIQRPEKGGFYVGQIKNILRLKNAEELTLSFGVPQCKVTKDGLERVAKITDQALYRGLDKSKADLMSQLKEGDFVLSSVKEEKPDGSYICDLERHPRIQGAAIVLDKGKVIAMVGGYSPHEYNRAAFAKRQPGSTFKTLTYYPALQLGWSALEPLLNVRNVYTWQGQFYYPRPDHIPEAVETTFIGAGAKSENLASIWLLAHLVDRLTLDQFKDLLEKLEIYQKSDSDQQFLASIGKTFNVKPAEDHIRAGLFNAVRYDLLQDVSLAADKRLRTVIRSMNFGSHFDDELSRVTAGKGGIPPKERLLRLHVLRNNFLRWSRLGDNARAAAQRIKNSVENGGLLNGEDRLLLNHFRISADGKSLAYVSPDQYLPSFTSNLLDNPAFKTLSPEEFISTLDKERSLLTEENILLDGLVPLYFMTDLRSQIDSRYKAVEGAPLLEKMFWHDDFRYSVGMYYARKMVKEMGVESDIQWVPSYPLGANVVTLSELALSYQTILNGNTYRYFETNQDNQLLLVSRIEDMQGNLLWEAQQKNHALIDDFYSAPMLSILRGTVTNGTGFSASQNIILRSKDKEKDEQLLKAGIRLPSFGKTGTTNDYVNATYVGFLPYPPEKGSERLSSDHAYTIAAYVGYDTNEQMRRRGFKVAGGTGALPAWIEIALSLIKEDDYAEKMDWKKLINDKQKEIPFDYGPDLAKFSVPLHSPYVANVEANPEAPEEKVDLNRFIDDYGANKGTPLRIALPGRVSGGVFEPRVRVSLFQSRKPSSVQKPTVPQGPAERLPALNGGGGGSGSESGQSDDKSNTSLPMRDLTPAPDEQSRLPEDKFDGGDAEDLNFELPPPPPNLGGQGAR